MQWLSLTRVVALTLFLAAVLISPALVVQIQPAGAQQQIPTPTPRITATPEADDNLPLTQADLNEFTGGVARPNGMVWLNENLYVVCAGDETIYKLYGTSGATDTYIYGITDAHTMYAEELANGAVNLWVPDTNAGSLLLITPVSVEVAVPGLTRPWGIAYLDPQTFLISNNLNGSIEAVTRSGDRVRVIQGLARPTGLDHDNRYLYVGNSGDTERAIEWYPLSAARNTTTAVNKGLTLVSGVDDVTVVRVGPDEMLYFAYAEDELGVIGRVDPAECRENGGCTIEEVERVVVTEMEAPLAGLTFSPDGRLFFHERYGERLFWVQVAGEPEPA